MNIQNVSAIGNYAFWTNDGIEYLNLPNVISIGIGCFRGNSKLTSVYAPNLLSLLGNSTGDNTGAFEDCIALLSIDFP